jgi:hypothetical protein
VRVQLGRGLAAARSRQGVALVMALLVLLSLSALVLAFLTMSALEPLISQNLADATAARTLADSGIELVFDTLATTADWSMVIAAASSRSCLTGDPGIAVIAPGTPLPGLPAGSGTIGVRARNDCQTSDENLTGTPSEAGRATTDGNGRLVLQSTGVKNAVARTISVVAVKATLFELDAALAFPGRQANIALATSALTIDGRDTRLTDVSGAPTGVAAPKFAITVAQSQPANATAIQNALGSSPLNVVTGQNASAPGLATGAATVTTSDGLTSQQVADFVGAIRTMADVTIDVAAGTTSALSGIGSTCAVDVDDTRCWGTDAFPKLVRISGGPSGAAPVARVTVSDAMTGTGILIIENARLEIQGDLGWHGPIIVTGTNVGVRFAGSGVQAVDGGVVVDELRSDGIIDPEAGVQGRARLSYSKEAVDLVVNGLGRRMTRTMNWREK